MHQTCQWERFVSRLMINHVPPYANQIIQLAISSCAYR